MESTNPAEKGASIEITVLSNGIVNIHRPQSDRAHSVIVDGQEAVRCSCKGHKYHGRCTHQDEVESRPIVVSSASAAQQTQVMADGGHVDTNDDIDDRFRLPEDPKHVEEPGTVELSRCPGCSRLTQHDTCGRTQCEGAEVNEEPL